MVTLITGGAGGIGLAIARELAARDGIPVVADLDLEQAQHAAADIPGADAVALDVTDPAGCADAVAQVVERHGRIDALVCCAGVFAFGGALDLTPEALDRTLKVNVHGTLYACQATARAMIEAGHGGSMVLFSSGAGTRAVGSPAYSASKGAVEALTRELASAFAEHRIRVNAVAPGVIDTEMASAAKEDPATLERLMAHTPLRRLGRPEEVAATVAFLLSDAASYVTASVVPTDGGFLSV